MKANAYEGALDQDKMTRASLPTGLFKYLGPPSIGRLIYGWHKTANTGPSFNGKTPVRTMCEGGTPAMMRTPQHIDAIDGRV